MFNERMCIEIHLNYSYVFLFFMRGNKLKRGLRAVNEEQRKNVGLHGLQDGVEESSEPIVVFVVLSCCS